jgi:hypothetical protein
MIPQVVTYCQRRGDGTWLRLYVPVVPVLLILSPLLVLVVVAGIVACAIFGIRVVDALLRTGRLLWALPGTQFHLDDGRMAVHIDVS